MLSGPPEHVNPGSQAAQSAAPSGYVPGGQGRAAVGLPSSPPYIWTAAEAAGGMERPRVTFVVMGMKSSWERLEAG